MLDIIIDTFIDTIKLVPFLFITYIVIEALEHQTSKKMEEAIEKNGKYGPIIGSICGLFPQCGFSTIAANLYATKIITVGTLIAIFLSTSDEMLPLMISHQVSLEIIVKVLGIKLICGMLAGLLIDLIHSKTNHIDIESFCEAEHCECDHGILHSAIIHTLKIALYILIINFVLNLAIDFIGVDTLKHFATLSPVFTVFLTTIIGLIPNCAASIIITELFLSNVISFGALIGGLLVNAGVGYLVLIRVNRNQKNNFIIILLTFMISLVMGLFFNIIM